VRAYVRKCVRTCVSVCAPARPLRVRRAKLQLTRLVVHKRTLRANRTCWVDPGVDPTFPNPKTVCGVTDCERPLRTTTYARTYPLRLRSVRPGAHAMRSRVCGVVPKMSLPRPVSRSFSPAAHSATQHQTLEAATAGQQVPNGSTAPIGKRSSLHRSTTRAICNGESPGAACWVYKDLHCCRTAWGESCLLVLFSEHTLVPRRRDQSAIHYFSGSILLICDSVLARAAELDDEEEAVCGYFLRLPMTPTLRREQLQRNRSQINSFSVAGRDPRKPRCTPRGQEFEGKG